MNRRKFLNTNLMALSMAGIVNTSEAHVSTQGKVKIKFYCPRWGALDSWDSFCARVKAAGYDGVEAAVDSPDVPEKQEMTTALKKHGLELIGQYWQSHETDLDAHAKNFERYLKGLASLNPVFINAQTGKDFFTFEQNKKLIDVAHRFTKETGILVVHETHRGKALFAAHIAQQYFEKMSDLRVTLDISHWCNVHESLLHDQAEAVDMAISRTRHIHSRVGHPEGPQVNDPRAGEWKDVVQAHLGWWDKIVAMYRASGSTLTITTEFGPPTYMPVLPYTQKPVADQWEINVYMMNFLKERYNVG